MSMVRLMLAGGTGRLVRRPSVVLFDPTGQNADLANRFDSAESDQEAVDELKQYLIDSGFSTAPLVVVQWERSGCNLLVFGDVEVHTSAFAAPMVSGAGSSTWVERQLGQLELGAVNSIEVWGGDAADPSTNLGLGVVACAGFRLSLTFADLAGHSVQAGVATQGHTVQAPEPVPSRAVADPALMAAALPAHPVVPATAEVSAPPPPPPPTALKADVGAGVVEPDPFTTTSSTVPTTPAKPAAHAPPESAPTNGVDTAHQADENSTTDHFAAAAPADDVGPPRAGLIEAAHCAQGHANPPRTAACYVCELELLEDQSLGLIEQPTVGRIVFRGGQELAVERAVLMGRKPDTTALGTHPVVIEHDEVSRSHALLTVEGWTVLLTDQGSRNGTWITPPNDPTPVRLGEQVPHVLEHGTTVYLGAPEVSFVYYFDQQ